MWDGSVTFGDSWAGYIGRADQNTAHSHVAIQLCIGVHQPVKLELPGQLIRAAGVIIGPNVEHRAVADIHPVAFVYINPDTPLGRDLKALLHDNGIALASEEMLECFRRTTSLAQFVEALARLLAMTPPIDQRLYKALNLLRQDRDGPGSVSRAANAVGLSSPRLRCVATHQMGVSLSQWIIWNKLERASKSLAAGASLSDAAADGGFSDQAHLARMMRRMFGMTPRTAAKVLRKTSVSFKTQ
jgi:AraC-like DNA-binding protein